MPGATIQDLLNSLPFTIPICCRPVIFKRHEGNKLSIRVGNTIIDRKLLAGRVTGIEEDATDGQLFAFAPGEEIRDFLKFYLHCPIGPEVLLGLHPETGNRQKLRHMLVNFSFVAWGELKSAKGKDGRFQRGMQCIAYRMDKRYPDEHCEAITRNPNGLCRSHDTPAARTYWNFFPPPVLEY